MPEQSDQKPRIFLCHAHEDQERVVELYHKLKEAGYHPWLDKFDLLPGQDWEFEIPRIIRESDFFLACLSKNSTDKRGYVQKEIKIGLDTLDQVPEGKIYLIPARLEECAVPERLKARHWVDLFEPNGFEYLTRALDFEIGKGRLPPQLKELDIRPPAVLVQEIKMSISASHNNVLVGLDNMSQALDGKPETRWSTRSPQSPDMWVEIDLHKVRTVGGLKLDSVRSPQDYPRGYSVSLSLDHNQWKEVARNDHNDREVNVSFFPSPARFIRIQQTGVSDRWWSIHQLILYFSAFSS